MTIASAANKNVFPIAALLHCCKRANTIHCEEARMKQKLHAMFFHLK